MRRTIGFSHRLAIFFVLLLVIGIAFVLTEPVESPSSSGPRFRAASIKGKSFNLEVADTPMTRVKGAAGKSGFQEGEGMIFIFEAPGKECFWMKDVSFSIDMLWFDAHKHLVHQERNVTPESYPTSFCPPTEALYVVEVSSGTAAALGIQKDDTLELKNL